MNSIEKANEKELVVAIKDIVNENEYLRRENRELNDRLNSRPVIFIDKEEMQELREQLDVREVFYALLESANKKLIKMFKLLKEKGLGVEGFTEKLKTGERFEHFHITFQCNCLETITKEEYELLKEALNG